MGCKNVGDSKQRKRKDETNKVKEEGGKSTKITKQVIETVDKDGNVITRTVVQKSVEVSAETKKKDNTKDETIDTSEFIKEALAEHNEYRSKHGAPPLKINSDLNKIAQKFAEKLAKKNTLEHSDNKYKGEDIGENTFMCGGYKMTGKDMSKAWYEEIYDYNFKKGEFVQGTGHFTQLVWASSKEVGFGIAKADDGSYYGVANYYPAGNFEGEFKDNVKSASGNHQPADKDKDKNKDKKKEVQRKQSSSSSDSDKGKGKGKGGELDLSKFIQESLQVHNQLRNKHKSPPFKINQELNKIAQKYAEKIAKSNDFSHSGNKYKGDNLGENLFMCGGYLITGKNMSQSWYDEIKDYDFKKATFSSGTGHFTQLVWAGSTEVGFGAAQAKDGSYYGVANYYPAGNFMGEFAENVKRA